MLNPNHKANRDLLTKMSFIRNTDGGLVVQRSYTYDKPGRPTSRTQAYPQQSVSRDEFLRL